MNTRRSQLRSLVRTVALPAIGMGAGVVAAGAISLVIPPTYEATASVIVAPSTQAGAGSVQVSDVSLALNLVSSVAELARSREVTQAVVEALDLPEAEVDGHLVGASQLGIQIVTVTASTGNAGEAAAMADAAADAMVDIAGRLQLGGAAVTVQPLDTASVPDAPTSPRLPVNLALGAVVGVLVGAGARTLRTRLDDRYASVAAVEHDLGLPALGVLSTPIRRGLPPASELVDDADAIEATDGLVAALEILVPRGSGRRILVTSAGDDDATALVAALLASRIGTAEHRPVLLDLSRRDDLLGRHVARGTTVHDALRRGAGGGGELGSDGPAGDRDGSAAVIPWSAVTEHLGDDPGAEAVADLLDALAFAGRDVVIVAPPVLTGRRLGVPGDDVDVALLAVDSDQVRRGDAGRAAMLLRHLDAALVGLVVLGSAASVGGWQPTAWPTPTPIGRHRSERRVRRVHLATATTPATTPPPLDEAPSGARTWQARSPLHRDGGSDDEEDDVDGRAHRRATDPPF